LVYILLGLPFPVYIISYLLFHCILCIQLIYLAISLQVCK